MKYAEEFWAIPKSIMDMTHVSLEARVIYGILFTMKNGKNSAWPSQKTIAEDIGIGERSVRRKLDELVEVGLIEVERRGMNQSNVYRFPDRTNVKSAGVANLAGPDRTPVAGPDRTAVSGPIHYKKRTKRKEHNIATRGVADVSTEVSDPLPVNRIMEAFQMSLNPGIEYGNKTQRKAIEDLLKAWGVERVIGAVKFIEASREDIYAPVITTPYQLKAKFAQLILYARKKGSREAKSITI
ncbi:MAG: helix-turn-helix domain-containing protein [Candidatus Omnitrophota bacterium]